MKTICFFLLFSFFGIFSLCVQSAKAAEPPSVSQKGQEPTVDEIAAQEDEEEFSRDPFESGLKGAAPIAHAEEPVLTEELELQGFAINGKKATVIINGKTYAKGAPARDGIEVVEVRRGEADIKWAGQAKTLKTMSKRISSRK